MDVFNLMQILSIGRIPVYIILAFSFAYTINWFVKRYISKAIDKNAEFLKVSPTNYNFLKNGFSIVIYTVAFFFVLSKIPTFQKASQALFTATGVFAAIAAFASQHALSNIISGIFIIIFKPFRVDDLIEFAPEKLGVVEDITLRHTVIRNFENRRFIVPNSIISDSIILNSDIKDQPVRRHMNLLLSYDVSLEKAFGIIREEVIKHPYHLDHRNEDDIQAGIPEVEIRVLDYLPNGLKIRAYLWAETHRNAFRLHTDVNYQIKLRFDQENIRMPYPLQRVQIDNFTDRTESYRENK